MVVFVLITVQFTDTPQQALASTEETSIHPKDCVILFDILLCLSRSLDIRSALVL